MLSAILANPDKILIARNNRTRFICQIIKKSPPTGEATEKFEFTKFRMYK